MQKSSPKSIATLLAIVLTVFSLIFLLSFQIVFTNQTLFVEILALIIVVFFGTYFLIYTTLKKYVYDRVKLIYKSLYKQKGVSE